MDIVLDLSFLREMLYMDPQILIWRVLLWFGWIPIAITLLWGFKEIWLVYRRGLWAKENADSILLAIDIPRENRQSVKAVENLFTYIAGAHGSINLLEKYWDGKWQLYFSFEIVSIEGYTQFLVHTPVGFRDLVESAVYSQYPDAEITEVDDYTKGYPTRYPDENYDLWGAEFILAKNDMFPIKTYPEFEHQFGKEAEEYFRDPMAALMDLNSSLGPGEQLWYQMIVIPTGFDWPKRGDKEISKILGEKTSSDKSFTDKMFAPFLSLFDSLSDSLLYLLGVEMEPFPEKEDDSFNMMNLKPKESRQIEGIEAKTSKLGFECKIRMVYLAEKEVMRKNKVVNGFVGYMKQFNDMTLNNLKPDMDTTATAVAYFLKDQRLNGRKNRIINNYMTRSDTGKYPFILNIEELATLWHFPNEAAVKAPLIQKSSGRKSDSPMNLPRQESVNMDEGETYDQEEIPEFLREEDEEEEKKEENNFISDDNFGSPPNNLPTI